MFYKLFLCFKKAIPITAIITSTIAPINIHIKIKLDDSTGGGENRSHVNNSVSVIADLSATDTVGAAVNMTTTDSGTVTSYGGDSGTRIIGFKLAGA